MSARTGISWTDSTFNPWIGCTKVSPACDHCYAERDMAIRRKRVEWGAGKPRSRTSAANWKLPERWNREDFRECDTCGRRFTIDKPGDCGHSGIGLVRARRRVFCASLADWLDNEVPIEWLVDFLDLVRRTPNLDWLLLTKRIGNWRGRLGAVKALLDSEEPPRFELRDWVGAWLSPTVHAGAPANVWLGSTVIDQPEADRDVPKLLAVSAVVRFLSIEPMLAPINIGPHLEIETDDNGPVFHPLHWVIAGGESGPHARPVHPGWIRSLRDQCQEAGVPFHFKQWGEWVPGGVDVHCDGNPPSVYTDDEEVLERAANAGRERFHVRELPGPTEMVRVGKKAAGRLLDGRTWDDFPRSAG